MASSSVTSLDDPDVVRDEVIVTSLLSVWAARTSRSMSGDVAGASSSSSSW